MRENRSDYIGHELIVSNVLNGRKTFIEKSKVSKRVFVKEETILETMVQIIKDLFKFGA